MKRFSLTSILLAAALAAAALWTSRPSPDAAPVAHPQPAASEPTRAASDWPAFLPPEARPVLQRIASGAAHPYRQDGSTFQNREGHLPAQPRGYYREFTVETPGLSHRGTRRIVTGGWPPVVHYYTDDHYESFRRFDLPREFQR